MTIDEIIKQCETAINSGAGEDISLIMPGKWGKTKTRRLCKGGPVGKIVSDCFDRPGIIVFFNAKEVKKFLEENR